MLQDFVEMKGALRTKKYREVLDTNISKIDGEKSQLLDSATVIISNGKSFYADPTSRVDLSDAISIAGETGQADVMWKLSEEVDGSKWSLCTLDELKEARTLALVYKGTVVGA